MDMKCTTHLQEGQAPAEPILKGLAQRTPATPIHIGLAILLACLSILPLHSQTLPQRDLQLLIVVGESGTGEYQSSFEQQTQDWRNLARDAQVEATVIGGGDEVGKNAASDREQLRALFETLTKKTATALWVILIGHGTFDGRETKFNLRGDDVTPDDFQAWLAPLKQEVVLIHTGSASGAFIKPLAGKNRLIITATKSADEFWATRFGTHFVRALRPDTPGADQDGQVSLLEAWLHTAKQIAISYDEEGRIATEHSLLEDNGDGIGARSESFNQLKPAAKAKESAFEPEGNRAHQLVLLLSPEEARLTEAQRRQRDTLESQIDSLNAERETLEPEKFYGRLEPLLLQLARLYDDAGD